MATGGGLSGFAWPENCGDFQMRIAADGTWFYRNSPIGRLKLVQLFAIALQRDDDGRYWLVTPGERGEVEVEDAPFVIVEMRLEPGDVPEIHFRTNLNHWFRLDDTHPLTMRAPDGDTTPRPYVHVRDGLDALVNRSVYYELVHLARVEGNRLLLDSAGHGFVLGTLDDPD